MNLKDPSLRAVSPFRYPGGKAFMSTFLAGRLPASVDSERHYAEPFCGGAGAALVLLKSGHVSHLHLNDADIRIYSAWKAILTETERFVERLLGTPLNIDTWYRASDLVKNYKKSCYDFDVGYATFFLNRTSRSGIILGAGPIGGYHQTGNWKIDARFNAPALAERILWIGSVAENVILTNEDGLTFLHRSLTRVPVDSTLFFVDPPYVKAGGRLYLNAMNEGKHIALSDILQGSFLKHWILTYDDHPLIRSIYSTQHISNLNVTYSLQNKRREREILIQPASG
ncbi:DNA adenine methylase [Pseudohoeflea coraliihabitans]|uniref:DNA adenine methylase n=1 Tax=Pseudohoeflea coraliihabitans TaxID=2860393 RepID=A0ABS6WSD3_9HYPH|nr:DNA adenine methylase [Pseudohoeflea sp. DP4N28-3]MBW3098863.1 DNA adenine methylase [Pseudohoeflea sp. DP4N28-3]